MKLSKEKEGQDVSNEKTEEKVTSQPKVPEEEAESAEANPVTLLYWFIDMLIIC